jgi:hypothetical protein
VSAKLSTTVGYISKISNKPTDILIRQFYELLQENGTSERHQNNNLKAIISFTNHIELKVLTEINSQLEILTVEKSKTSYHFNNGVQNFQNINNSRIFNPVLSVGAFCAAPSTYKDNKRILSIRDTIHLLKDYSNRIPPHCLLEYELYINNENEDSTRGLTLYSNHLNYNYFLAS